MEIVFILTGSHSYLLMILDVLIKVDKGTAISKDCLYGLILSSVGIAKVHDMSGIFI